MDPIYLQLAVAALGGGGISFVIGKLIDNRFAREGSEIERLREDIKTCTIAHENCEKKLDGIIERLRAVEASTPSYLARWVKDHDKRVIWLNDRAYMTIFAPLGLERGEVLDKTFRDLLGDGAGEALGILDDLDTLALRAPGETQSTLLQLHPDLPTMAIIKVAGVSGDGLLRYEGCAYVPSGLSDAMGMARAKRARDHAARHLFQEAKDD